MALEVTGKLIVKQPTQQIKENFSKREFVIEISQQTNTGMTFTNFASFQLVNNACAMIDQFQLGQDVKVSFDIRGNKWEKDGQVRYITNLNAWRVEPAMQQQQQGGYQQPQQQYGGGMQQAPAQPSYTPPQQPQGPSFDPGVGDDLPF
ncbi:DUF3127 domain-containing protein [Edaphocola flava]|jgi:hypothetical protein|uniref:DUF3127 domain-containing protein n=1 Tax=Edaphocola flava TaxID=2499629 RepID=UPI00100B40AA|nr:DUF3127 domain-containing protein [Edaphocola flava]